MKGFWNSFFVPQKAQFSENGLEGEQVPTQEKTPDSEAKAQENLVFDDDDLMEQPAMPTPGIKKRVNKPTRWNTLYGLIKMRTTMSQEKINGFRFSGGGPITPNFIVGLKYDLLGPQAQPSGDFRGSTAQLMESKMADKASKFSLDLQYVGARIPTPGGKPWVLVSSHDSTGKQTCIVSKQFTDRFNIQFQGQFHARGQLEWNFIPSYEGDQWRCSLTYGNAVREFNYVQSIGRKFQSGFNLQYIVPARSLEFSLAARYMSGFNIWLGKCNPIEKTFGIGCITMIDKKTMISTEFTNHSGNPMDKTKTTKAVVGVSRNLESSQMKFTMNSKWDMKSYFSIGNAKFALVNLNLYAEGNLYEDRYKFGYGVSYGSG